MCNYQNCNGGKYYNIDYFDWARENLQKPSGFDGFKFCSPECLYRFTKKWICCKCGNITSQNEILVCEEDMEHDERYICKTCCCVH